MESAPRNPYLAASVNPIAHGTCAQQDSTPVAGPTGPSGDAEVLETWLGPGQFGFAISSPYPDGSRVFWNNGSESITKIDAETFEVLATHPLPGRPTTDEAEVTDALARLDGAFDQTAVDTAIELALAHMVGLQGVYFVLDCDNVLFLGYGDEIVAFADDRTDPRSPIVERGRWVKPPEIGGQFVGMGITFDGWLVATTEYGWVVSIARDFSEHRAVRLRHADDEDAAAETEQMAAERQNRGFGWVRTSCCTDPDGIYASSRNHTHKVIWRDQQLSIDEADGAWTARYPNGAGLGSGTTPCLMGFGENEDRFVVIGDGDDVVNITLLWRDEIPADWRGLPGAPDRRIAGSGRADMGDRSATAIQTEQSITVSGYGAMTVNNEPAWVPDGFPERGRRLLVFWLAHHAAITPYGLHKYEWDPERGQLVEAWVCSDVSSPNAVPHVSEVSDLVYTCGVRDGAWTIEAIDWSTGESTAHWVLGGSRYNTRGAGITLDDQGHICFGTFFGKVRLDPRGLLDHGPRR